MNNYGIGDCFNGMLALSSYKKKTNQIDKISYVKVPPHRAELVNIFSNANLVPVHNVDYDLCFSTFLIPNVDHSFYGYNYGIGLNGDDLFDNYNIEGKIIESITSDDIILFPTISGHQYLVNPNIFIDLIHKYELPYKNIFYNSDPDNSYVEKFIDNSNIKILKHSINDILYTIKHKNPIIIGQRSGMFDVIFHTIKKARAYIIFDINTPYQEVNSFLNMDDSRKKAFEKYSKERMNFTEIYIRTRQNDYEHIKFIKP
jgi:hypothetical protein